MTGRQTREIQIGEVWFPTAPFHRVLFLPETWKFHHLGAPSSQTRLFLIETLPTRVLRPKQPSEAWVRVSGSFVTVNNRGIIDHGLLI
jgi:hypothetical protein